jgi:peptidoglycan/LPS O-acetylase OafA/YrhL
MNSPTSEFSTLVQTLSSQIFNFRQSTGWWWHYFETHFRLGEYLIGVITGYIMHNQEISSRIERKLNKKKIFLWICWSLSIGFLWFHIFQFPSLMLTPTLLSIYTSVEREVWACAMCWIVFACHSLKSGGIIGKVLSYPAWQILSKLCLSIYLLHFPMLLYTADYYQNVFGFMWLMNLHAGDVVLSMAAAVVAFILVEAPVGHVIEAAWKLSKIVKTKETEFRGVKYQKL